MKIDILIVITFKNGVKEIDTVYGIEEEGIKEIADTYVRENINVESVKIYKASEIYGWSN